MNLSRRRQGALAGLAILASLGAWWRTRTRPTGPDAPSLPIALRAWVDTLMPAEPGFPGALALGVADTLAAAVERTPAYAALAREALEWVDAQARQRGGASFAALPADTRESVVAAAQASPPGSAPRTFFDATRDDVMFHAYADPRAWEGIGYAGPPQPIGFLDHASKPKPG